MSDRYIQSIYSKDARVWEVRDCPYNYASPPSNDWCVEVEGGLHWLPKSEYVEVPAPERWADVTAQCVVDDYENRVGAFWSIIHAADGNRNGPNVMSKENKGYHLKKVQVNFIGPGVDHGCQRGMAFIIERKVKS